MRTWKLTLRAVKSSMQLWTQKKLIPRPGWHLLRNDPKPPILPIIATIFNEIIETSVYPEEWSKYFIILIPKDKLGKFRPIALSQCLLKLLESILNKRILFFCEKKHIFSRFQSGFRRGKACMYKWYPYGVYWKKVSHCPVSRHQRGLRQRKPHNNTSDPCQSWYTLQDYQVYF